MNHAPRLGIAPGTSVFALPEQLVGKAAPELIDQDETHLRTLAAAHARVIRELTERRAQARTTPVRMGQEALDRDLEIHQVSARLRVLNKYSTDLCLGRMVFQDTPIPVYIGRVGLQDENNQPLVVDWRSPAAAPFFAATQADPQGLSSRRRYRWAKGQVVDYWDEVFTRHPGGPAVSLDDDSALLASLAQARTPRMRSVLATLAADQDAIIRADARRPLLVDGGPGTGKTVVALHRAAYLLYSDTRLQRDGGSVLFVGPHESYLSYVADVLPDLGEDGVRTCTIADLYPVGISPVVEPDPAVAALKSTAAMVEAIEPAVALYEEPPGHALDLETAWGTTRLRVRDWADAFAAVEPGTPHNEAHDQIWQVLAEILAPTLTGDDQEPTVDDVEADLRGNSEVAELLYKAWPLLEPDVLVADLWEVPAYLRRCAPWLTREEAALLRRPPTSPWSEADLPLIDAARYRLGQGARAAADRRRRLAEEEAADRMDAVIADLKAHDDSEMQVMSMLTGADLRRVLLEDTDDKGAEPADLSGPFEHIIIDEAQELTDTQWAMILRRCPSRSLTIVGDRAQARHGFPEAWSQRLARVGLRTVNETALTINYRTPAEVMSEAAPVIRAVMPDANVPQSIRTTGIAVRYDQAAALQTVLDTWLAENTEGTAVVIANETVRVPDRARHLTPQDVKGLEFDLVVILNPDRFGPGTTGAVDRYVAMTRTTHELVILTSSWNGARCGNDPVQGSSQTPPDPIGRTP